MKNIDLKLVDDFVAIRRAQESSKYKDQKNAPFVSQGEVNKDLTYFSAVLTHAQRSGATVQYIDWHKAKLGAGINRKVRFHDIRHTTATRLLMLSKDIRLVQQYLGHSDIKSTLHYAEYNTAEKQRGMDLLSEIGDKNGDTRRKKAVNG